ncbi:AAA domain-containing protein [Mycena amicta]|nr:AAA domain-containing protein [Mycena amicta]
MSADSESRLAAFFARQRVLLAQERAAEVERSSLLLTNCSPKLLEQKGLAVLGVGVVNVSIGLGGKTLVELERPSAYHTNPVFPPHTLRTGDLARIEANVTTTAKKASSKTKAATPTSEGKQVEGVVYRVTDTRIVVAVNGSESASEDLDLPERVRLVKLANSVTYDRMDKTMDQLERIVSGKSEEKIAPEKLRLIHVLLAMSTRSADTENALPNLEFFDDSLNPSQKDAVRFALQAAEVACIHGPPGVHSYSCSEMDANSDFLGTGKTHTLIEILRQLTSGEKPLRVLVCGASNLSVDNILERLLALPVPDKGSRIKVTRIGHPARVMSNASILESTLEVKAGRSEQAILAKDVKVEIEAALSMLSGKGKSKMPRGAERRKMWDEVKALRKEYRQREGGVVKTVLADSQVVVATCHSAGGRQLRNHEFDVVIIDEATQAMEAVCWVPILKGRKLILAGDPMQLPPTVLSVNKKEKKDKSKRPEAKPATKNEVVPPPPPSESDSESSGSEEEEEEKPKPAKAASTTKPKTKQALLKPPRTLETTLFDRLEKMYGKSVKRMLQVQYRMHQDICAFPSATLYGSKLASAPSVEKHLLLDLPETHADSADDEKEVLGTPVVFFDTAGCEYFERLEGDGDEGSRCNENEATVVKNWVDRLVGAGVLPSQIAVISPYQAQVTLLTSLIRPQYGAELEIGTVDGMQGREKEAVVISLVRSNQMREVGFLKEKRRLNVAMTRAKRHLCVVGDSGTVSYGGKYLKKWLSWLEANADVQYAGLE